MMTLESDGPFSNIVTFITAFWNTLDALETHEEEEESDDSSLIDRIEWNTEHRFYRKPTV